MGLYMHLVSRSCLQSNRLLTYSVYYSIVNNITHIIRKINNTKHYIYSTTFSTQILPERQYIVYNNLFYTTSLLTIALFVYLGFQILS